MKKTICKNILYFGYNFIYRNGRGITYAFYIEDGIPTKGTILYSTFKTPTEALQACFDELDIKQETKFYLSVDKKITMKLLDKDKSFLDFSKNYKNMRISISSPSVVRILEGLMYLSRRRMRRFFLDIAGASFEPGLIEEILKNDKKAH